MTVRHGWCHRCSGEMVHHRSEGAPRARRDDEANHRSIGRVCLSQTLRSSSQLLPAWECMRASLETALSLEGVEAEVPLAPLPLPHTQGHPAAREMLPWRPCRTGLTAGQAPWRFAEPEACRTWRAEARPSAPRHRGQRQAIGGVVLRSSTTLRHPYGAHSQAHRRPWGLAHHYDVGERGGVRAVVSGPRKTGRGCVARAWVSEVRHDQTVRHSVRFLRGDVRC
jgi:hypothetical protein